MAMTLTFSGTILYSTVDSRDFDKFGVVKEKFYDQPDVPEGTMYAEAKKLFANSESPEEIAGLISEDVDFMNGF